MESIDIKKIIKEHRIQAGLTMKELADCVGVSEATVSRWESGNIASMKHSQIASLCKALHISPALLVPGIDIPSSEPTNTPDTLYYDDPEVARMANELKNNPDLHILFDASKKLTKKDLEAVITIVQKMSSEE